LTPEKQKEKLQEDALAFLSELGGIQEEPSVGILLAFNNFLEISEPGNLDLDSSEGLLYEDVYGKYTWNPYKENWVYSPLDDMEPHMKWKYISNPDLKPSLMHSMSLLKIWFLIYNCTRDSFVHR
jgi:hypothetical protein